MTKRFNTAGPCRPDLHYMLPAERRLPEARALVEQMAYFVVHAPRQAGKTTALRTLADALTTEGRHAALLVSMEVGQPFADDPGAAEAAVLDSWRGSAEARLPQELQPPAWPSAAPGARLGAALAHWARACPRPLVLFIDEIDALQDQALVAVLRQLRSGYPDRGRNFPASVALIGLRDVRDYKVTADAKHRLGTASPFNIKTESLSLRDFTEEELGELYAQHTVDTGQAFAPDAIQRSFAITRGQPWLVNALARQCVEVLVPDRSLTIELRRVEEARAILVERQDTHLDSLAERLREERVRAIIEPILAGDVLPSLPPDDLRYVEDLGLVRRTNGSVAIANELYADVIPTALSYITRASMPALEPAWLGADGAIDFDALLQSFLDFWRAHAEALLGTAPYHEIAPHLVLMAFLHRVVNGGGSIEREYAVGTGRMDLLLRWRAQRLAIELKIWRDGRADPVDAGLAQLERYMDRLGVDCGWLVIFDRRTSAPPLPARVSHRRTTTASGGAATIVRA